MELWYTEEHAEDVRFSIKTKKCLHTEQTPFQRIDFFESETFGTFFTLDGLMMVTEKDEFAYHEMIAHIPMAVHQAKRVLIIGGGDGGTAREVARYPFVERIDMVEIDERVVRLCQQYLPQTASCLDRDARIHLYFQDGLEWVRNAPAGAYDLILVDSTDPVGPGEGLFTRDFYENCFRALTSDGVLINQHESPYYAQYAKEMRRAHRKISAVFPVVKVYEFHMPTYPSGHWLFGFASKGRDPIADANPVLSEELGLSMRYYTSELHAASFALPAFVKQALEDESDA